MPRTAARCCGAFPQERTPSNRRALRSFVRRKRYSGGRECGALPRSDRTGVEICDLFLKQPVKVEACPQPNKGAAQSYRGAIHEYKFSWGTDSAKFPQLCVDLVRLLEPVLGRGYTIVNEPRSVVEQRREDEPRPHVHDAHQFRCNRLEAPPPICGRRKG